MKLNVDMHMGLLTYASFLILVQEVTAILHAVEKPEKPSLKIKMKGDDSAEKKASAKDDESPALKVRVPKKVTSKPTKRRKSKSAEAPTPAQCFDLSAGTAMNVQSINEHFGNHSFLLSLAPGAADPSGEKALATLYEALLGDCDTTDSLVVDVGAGNGQVSALAADMGCRVSAFDPDVDAVRSLKASRCLNNWMDVFSIFPMMAAARPGGDISVFPSGHTIQASVGNKSGDHIIHGVSLDGVFVKGDEKKLQH